MFPMDTRTSRDKDNLCVSINLSIIGNRHTIATVRLHYMCTNYYVPANVPRCIKMSNIYNITFAFNHE